MLPRERQFRILELVNQRELFRERAQRGLAIPLTPSAVTKQLESR